MGYGSSSLKPSYLIYWWVGIKYHCLCLHINCQYAHVSKWLIVNSFEKCCVKIKVMLTLDIADVFLIKKWQVVNKPNQFQQAFCTKDKFNQPLEVLTCVDVGKSKLMITICTFYFRLRQGSENTSRRRKVASQRSAAGGGMGVAIPTDMIVNLGNSWLCITWYWPHAYQTGEQILCMGLFSNMDNKKLDWLQTGILHEGLLF